MSAAWRKAGFTWSQEYDNDGGIRNKGLRGDECMVMRYTFFKSRENIWNFNNDVAINSSLKSRYLGIRAKQFKHFNKYVAVSAQTLRSVLKEDLKANASKREVFDVKVVKFKNGEPLSDPVPLSN